MPARLEPCTAKCMFNVLSPSKLRHVHYSEGLNLQQDLSENIKSQQVQDIK
jgi:hypothetical protein